MSEMTIAPQTVGDHLREDYLPEYGLKAPTIAKKLGVGRQRVVRLLEGARCDADMALRLARFFGTTPEFWMGLQAQYELDVARANMGPAIEEQVQPVEAA